MRICMFDRAESARLKYTHYSAGPTVHQTSVWTEPAFHNNEWNYHLWSLLSQLGEEEQNRQLRKPSASGKVNQFCF